MIDAAALVSESKTSPAGWNHFRTDKFQHGVSIPSWRTYNSFAGLGVGLGEAATRKVTEANRAATKHLAYITIRKRG